MKLNWLIISIFAILLLVLPVSATVSWTNNWTEVNHSAGFGSAYGGVALSGTNGYLYYVGGYQGGSNSDKVWRSTDNGTTWTNPSVLGDGGAYFISGIGLADGSLIVGNRYISSDDYTLFRSTDYAATWTAYNPGWSARHSSTFMQLSNATVLMMLGTGKNDTWRSPGSGWASWTKVVESNGIPADNNGKQDDCAILSNDHIVCVRGYDGDAFIHNRTYRSTDAGVSFTLVNSSSGWLPRSQSSMVAYNDVLVLFGGYYGGTQYNDTWISTDEGSTWQFVKNAEWTGRSYASSTKYGEYIYIIAGDPIATGEVWKYNTTSSVTTPVNGFYCTPYIGAAPLYVHCIDTSTNTPTMWEWFFSDGLTDNTTLQNPYHTFATGNWTVQLHVGNSAGWDNATGTYYIYSMPAPTASFTKDKTGGASPLTVTFTDTSTDNPTSWLWNFGDGNSTNNTQQNPIHIFTGAGTYDVNVTATNAYGSDTSPSQTITVGNLPVASYTRIPNYGGLAPQTVVFTFTGSGASSYLWNFDDGSSENETEQNPTHTFTSAGVYHVNVAATNGYGTITSISLPMEVGYPAATTFSPNTTSGEEPLTVLFTGTGQTAPWTLQTASASWAARYTPSAVVLNDNSIVIMGGLGSTNYNDVWISTNKGLTWTQQTAAAGWSARRSMSVVRMSDNKIVLMGGLSGSNGLNSVWISSNQGATWTQQNASAAWTGRYGAQAVRLSDDSIVIMGGQYNTTLYLNDVWRSTDNGVNWVQQTASPGWAVRSNFRAVVTSDDSIVLIGGYGTTGYKNDVWISRDKGVTWTQQTAAIGWSARFGHTAVILPNDVIIAAGGYSGGVYKNDTWYSKDHGVSWTQMYTTSGWNARYYGSMVALNDYSVVQMAGREGGVNMNDVWIMYPMGIDQFMWTTEGVNHVYPGTTSTYTHTYTTHGLYNMSLRTWNIFGYTTSALTDITVTLHDPLVTGYIANVTSGTGAVPPSIPVNFVANYTGGAPTSYQWWFNGTYTNLTSPTVTFVNPGVYPVNITLTNANGTSSWNGSYTVIGKAPHMIVFAANPWSGTESFPTSNITFTVGFNTTHYGTPTTYLWTWGDGTAAGSTNPAYHVYTAAGTYSGSIRASNVWGYDQYNFTYVVLPYSIATLKWVKADGTTITSAYSGDTVYFSFDTVTTGQNTPTGYIADQFEFDVYKRDVNTGNWVVDVVRTSNVKPSYGASFFTTNTSVALPTTNGTVSWIGYVTLPTGATDADATYNIGIRAVNNTNPAIYPDVNLGNVSISVAKNPLLLANVGVATTDTGGWGLNLILSAIIVLILVMIPFLITRTFNVFIEVFMAALGVGLSYFMGLIQSWVIIGMVIIAAIVIFFMSRQGGEGGQSDSEGDIG